jgi:hypothetical protein
MASETITLTTAGKKFWGTKKSKVRVTITDRPVRTYGGYWSGGSRSEWWMQRRTGGALTGLSVRTNPFDSGDPEYTPTADTAIVQGGTFEGKPSTLGIYVTSKEGWTW